MTLLFLHHGICDLLHDDLILVGGTRCALVGGGFFLSFQQSFYSIKCTSIFKGNLSRFALSYLCQIQPICLFYGLAVHHEAILIHCPCWWSGKLRLSLVVVQSMATRTANAVVGASYS